MFRIIALIILAAVLIFACSGTKEASKDQKEAVVYETTASGLRFLDLVPGTGKKPSFGNRVKIHIIGKLENGTVLENSYEEEGPIEFTIGDGEAIMGIEEGLLMMRQGGKRRLVIPPELAYGRRGVGEQIPPNATLIIDVELLSVN